MDDRGYYRPYHEEDDEDANDEKNKKEYDDDDIDYEDDEDDELQEEEEDLQADDLENQRTDDTNTDDVFDLISSPNFRSFANALKLIAGPAFSKTSKQLTYGKNRIGKRTHFSSYEEAFEESETVKKLPEYKRTKVETREVVNNPILIDSTKRDRRLYTQPTFFSTRLPRVYKNITNFNFAEMSFLNRFYYFRPSKNNVSITIQELDRDPITVYLRQGSYSINQLKTEMETQLNRTPLFYDYASSNPTDYAYAYNTFYTKFNFSKDFSLNFNNPGSNFYNNTTNSFLENPTVNDIVSAFWTNITSLSLGTNLTSQQIFLVYYYPILKEIIQDETYSGPAIDLTTGLGIDPTVTTIDDVRSRILYTFQGISAGSVDPVVYAVANANRDALDKYRLAHTFRTSLVNAYTVSISPQDSRVTISSSSLNLSLVRLLSQQFAIYSANYLSNAGITLLQYQELKNKIGKLDKIVSDMYDFTQTHFSDYFAIPYNTYTKSYYSILDNTVKLRPGLSAVGIAGDPIQAQNSNIVATDLNVLAPLQVNPKIQWPNMTGIGNTVYMSSLSNVDRGNMNHPYNTTTNTIDESFQVIDTSGGSATYYIQPNLISKKVDCVVPIEAGSYTTFQFHSPVRQTLQIETLPQPAAYRYPAYNTVNYGSTINKYFSTSYTYDVSAGSYALRDPLRQAYSYDNFDKTKLADISGWTDSTATRWLTSYSESKAFFPTTTILGATQLLGTNAPWLGLFYQFVCPDVSGSDPTTAYRYQLNLTTELYADLSGEIPQTPTNNFRAFVYEDRAGFQGDLYYSTATYTNFRSENPLNWKYSTVIGPTDTSGTIVMPAYPGQKYYVSFRADAVDFGSIYTRIFPWFASDASSTMITMTRLIDGINPATDAVTEPAVYLSNYNYASAYDSAALALPNTSTLWGGDPDLTQASFAVDINPTKIGYDINNISSDYLDYIPYSAYSSTFAFNPRPDVNLGFDPNNRFLFQSNSPYDFETRSYLYAGSANTVYAPNAFFPYTPSNIPARQDKIAHYYSPTYIPESAYVRQATGVSVTSLITDGPAQTPYTSTTTAGPIDGYLYDTSGHINLNFGTLGFTFAPSEGLWSIDRLLLRSAIYSATESNDPNTLIKYIGVFKTADIDQTQFINWNVSSAVALLSNSKRDPYAPRTAGYDLTTDPDNAGFDIRGGTYYEYAWDSNYVPTLRSSTIEGYTKPIRTITNDPDNLYSLICLDSNYQPTTFKAMSGSVVPYPYHSRVSTGATYLETGIGSLGTVPPRSLVMPSTLITDVSNVEWKFLSNYYADISAGIYGPPQGYDESQSIYLQSMPIATSVLHTRRQNDPFTDLSGVNPWLTPYYPTAVHMRSANHAMLHAGDFYIYSFDQLTTTLEIPTSNLQHTLTESDIFDPLSGISLVGSAGTSTEYAFLGWKSNGSTTDTYITMFNPDTETVYTYTPTTPIVIDDPTPQFNSFTINNAGDVIISAHCPSVNKSRIYWYKAAAGTTTDTSGSTNVRLLHSQDPSGSVIGFYTLNVDYPSGQGSQITYYGTGFGDATTYTLAPQAGSAPTYSGIAVNSVSDQQFEDPILLVDDIILYSTDVGYESKLYQVRALSGPTTLTVDPLATTFIDASGLLTIERVFGGYQAGYWAITNRPPYGLWGNRNNVVDLRYRVESELQIFYPFQKISLVQTGTSFNPMLDVSGFMPQEYLHTNLFYYPDVSSYYADVSGKWGLEKNTNFTVGDTEFRGNYFESYIFDVPLQPSSGSDYQFITVRGYSPTESGTVMLRFNLKNLYDYGYATFRDISNEIQLYQTTPQLFNPDYGATLEVFDSNYITSDRHWGQDERTNFLGSNYQIVNYASFISTYSDIFYQYNSTSAIINQIDVGATSTLKAFIANDLRYILPSSANLRQNYTDPLPFKINWFSALPENFKPLKDNWGLGFNLGFAKRDTNYATYHVSDSAYKIIDDYIYLQLNQADNMNRLDICEEENYDRTTEFTGEINRYYGKLLLNGYNQKCTNLVQNSVKFSPPLARLDKFTFTWVDQTGVQLDNADCEWTATATITERKTVQVFNENGEA